LRVVLDHSPVWMGGGRWGWCIKYYFLHTKIQITNQILTFRPQKFRGRFFELFESGAGGLRVVLDHSPVWMGGGRWGWCIKYYFLHTKIQITNQILTVCPRKRRSRFFELFESGAGRKDGCSFSEGFEQRGGGIKKLVSCRGRKWSAEGRTMMATDDWRASVGG
jgi:hypothetical protein